MINEGEKPNIAFLGVGRMASALISRFTKSGVCKVEDIIGTHYDPIIAKEKSKELGVRMLTSNVEAIENCSVIFICTRPTQVKDLIKEIRGDVNQMHTVISIAVGVPLHWLSNSLLLPKSIFHVHPSSLVMAQSLGISYITFKKGTCSKDLAFVESLFEGLGKTIVVPEDMMDLYAVFSGCSPAFFARFALRWKQHAEEAGIPKDHCDQIISAIFTGIGNGLGNMQFDFKKFENLIATPGGVTERGLRTLMAKDIDGSLISVEQDCLEEISKIRFQFEKSFE